MELIEDTQNGVLVLSLQGRIDRRTSYEFEQKVMSLGRGPEGATQVVMDFAGLDYINSAGMQVLLVLGKRLAGVGGKLVLCGMKEPILEVFKIIGFDQILSITDTQADALEQLPRRRSNGRDGSVA